MTAVEDIAYMTRALKLARRGRYSTDPNPCVGAVLVNGGHVVAEGWHRRAGEPHAEAIALASAGVLAKGATLYVTLEPCCHHGRTPPCIHAIIAARVSRVVAAMHDPNPKVAGEGLAQLREAGIEVECGLLGDMARELNPGFIKRMKSGMPLVRVKLAMSLDGRTAMADGESKWITGEDARRDVHRLRAGSSAIITGIGTVLADDPTMDVRLGAGEPEELPVRQPLRVVLDPFLAIPRDARILMPPGKVLVFCAKDAPGARELPGTAEVIRVPAYEDRLDLRAVLMVLARREVNEVLVETGATLAGAFVQGGLVDELVIYIAPHLMGDHGRALLHLAAIEHLRDRIEVDIREMQAVGRDWRIRAVPKIPGR